MGQPELEERTHAHDARSHVMRLWSRVHQRGCSVECVVTNDSMDVFVFNGSMEGVANGMAQSCGRYCGSTFEPKNNLADGAPQPFDQLLLNHCN